jgi:anaerobic selenocysteine-containing dehydrogenase
MFGTLGVPGERALNALLPKLLPVGYDHRRNRLGGFPEVLGSEPATLMAKEITTPGPDQVKALFVSAGNPVLSVPNGDELEAALPRLDLCVSLDLYVNETNQHADYVLPATTFYEREDVPLAFLGLFTTPFIQATGPVVEPPGECRQEWAVIDDIARRIGVAPYSDARLRLLAKLGVRPGPERVVDLLLRTGPGGDLFGLRRGGLSLAKLRRHPHGLLLGEHIATGVLKDRLHTTAKRLRLCPPEIADEIERLASVNGADPQFPLRLIGMREQRSHNSWMHNAPLLMRGGRTHLLRVHPDDAALAGLEDGGDARLESKDGAVTVPVKVTDEMTPGTVALPHGWGHRGGWRLANQHGGANVNLLAGGAPEDLERLAGMAHLNGIPVRVSPVRL